jgi:hypothetical protein
MKHISTYILEIVLFQIVFPFVDDYICTRLHSMGTAGYLAAHVSFGILFHYHAVLWHLFLNQDDLKNTHQVMLKQQILNMSIYLFVSSHDEISSSIVGAFVLFSHLCR